MVIVVKNLINHKEEIFQANNINDFEVIFMHFPYTKEIALRSDGLEDAAYKISEYFSQSSRFESRVIDARLFKDESPIPIIQESEDFKTRLTLWLQGRADKDRSRIPRDSTYVSDPGRLREVDLDELDEKPKNGVLNRVKWAIKRYNKDKS